MGFAALDLSTLDPKHAAKLLKEREWRAANPGKAAARQRAWREANPGKEAARRRAWREANPEKAAEKQRAWHEANPGKAADRQRAWRATERDSYLRSQFVRNLPIAPEAVPQEAIEIYRLTRLIGRAIKEQTA